MPQFDYNYQTWFPVFLLLIFNLQFPLNSKGEISSPSLKLSLTLDSEDKCLQNFTSQ
jgi:hypothetical protein